jgi:hypothetical protein
MLNILLALAGLVLAVAVAIEFVVQYRAASGEGWQRIWNAARGSATLAWQKFGLVMAGRVASLDMLVGWIGQALNQADIADKIQTGINAYVTPQYVGIAFAIYIAVTVIARLRTLGRG